MNLFFSNLHRILTKHKIVVSILILIGAVSSVIGIYVFFKPAQLASSEPKIEAPNSPGSINTIGQNGNNYVFNQKNTGELSGENKIEIDNFLSNNKSKQIVIMYLSGGIGSANYATELKNYLESEGWKVGVGSFSSGGLGQGVWVTTTSNEVRFNVWNLQ